MAHWVHVPSGRSLRSKPLVLLGARQVGKTSLVREFARQQNLELFECNFKLEPKLKSLFTDSLRPSDLLPKLSLYHGKDFNPNSSLLFFDEVQECGPALTSLKYLCEDAPEVKTIAAGSLLGLSLSEDSSFPVGKVNFLPLYRLSLLPNPLVSFRAKRKGQATPVNLKVLFNGSLMRV